MEHAPIPKPLEFREYPWPEDMVLTPATGLDAMAAALRLSPVPMAAMDYLGSNGRRQGQDQEVDRYMVAASKSATWAVGSFQPLDPLRNLVDAVLANAGLFYLLHPDREEAIKLRAQFIPRLYDLARNVGLGSLRRRAAQVARRMERGTMKIPKNPIALLPLLSVRVPRRAHPEYELGITDSGRRGLSLGRHPLQYERRRGDPSRIRPDSRAARFLVAVVLREAPDESRRADITHVRVALKSRGVGLVRRPDGYVLTRELTVSAELRSILGF